MADVTTDLCARAEELARRADRRFSEHIAARRGIGPRVAASRPATGSPSAVLGAPVSDYVTRAADLFRRHIDERRRPSRAAGARGPNSGEIDGQSS